MFKLAMEAKQERDMGVVGEAGFVFEPGTSARART
jgi:hypothetical protein